ncbi:malonate decarboxylase epsilon subunit [Geomicrobium halophilum]|uniref:Malonyl CoA-acyl carrier protein transacylase n=1 Tax=Geomicrobium halophilum TaxID=549000 RepID=A0A841PSL1_9BACL|nr:malonate decarboxylase epsilon subunit [Geomicrobium halophilum]
MVVFLFPGQGSQFPDMFYTLPNHPKVEETIERANICVGENPYDWSKHSALQSSRNVQLSLLTIGVGCAQALLSEGISPQFVAGHSVGTFSAAVTANVLSFEDALQVVKYRGEKMEEAYPYGYGMGVIQGLDNYTVDHLLQDARKEGHTVYIANENSETQIVISGCSKSIEHAFSIASEKGAKKMQWLDVKVPSHSPLFSELAEKIDQKLQTINLSAPKIPYVSNRSARLLRDSEKIREDLAFNIEAPVRWHSGMTMLYERGARQFLQLPPGRIYAELASQVFEDVRALSLTNNLDSIAKFLRRSG